MEKERQMCAHVREDGSACESLAQTDSDFCYQHDPKNAEIVAASAAAANAASATARAAARGECGGIDETSIERTLWNAAKLARKNKENASQARAISNVINTLIAYRKEFGEKSSGGYVFPPALLFDQYQPLPGQWKIHNAAKRFTIVAGGVRSGKTFPSAREFASRIGKDRAIKPGKHLHYWAVAPTYLVGRVQMRELLTVFGGNGGPCIEHFSKSDRIMRLHSDIEIEFRTANDPNMLVGESLDGMWIDEAARCKAGTWVGGLRGRVVNTKGWALFSTTPCGQNWFWDEIVSEAVKEIPNPEFGLITLFTEDNTTIEDIAEECAKAKAEYPGPLFEREFRGSFDAFTGQIYTDFSRATHVVDDLPEHVQEIKYGQDWGMSNPGALLCGKRDKDGVWWIVDEIYQAGQIDDWWRDKAREFVNQHGIGRIYADPENPNGIKKYRLAGLECQGADNAVVPGIKSVAALLAIQNGAPRLVINRRCKNLIRELGGYSWKDHSKKDEPQTQNDHTCDAVRYLIHSKPSGGFDAW